MTSLTATAQARIGLLGNPSDIYGGRGLGFSVAEIGVEVTLSSAVMITLPNDLLRAGWLLAERELNAAGIDPRSRPFDLTFASTIPFQGGLSGSSALLIAALRAWSRWFGLWLEPARIAELAWRAENEVLGIRAGPLDRLVQAHDGLLAMDFADPFAVGAVERLEPDLLPPLLLAWHGTPGQSSGDVHAPVFARWQAGDAEVRDIMQQLAANAMAGRDALLAADHDAFRASIDRNFDLRARVFPIAAADRALIELGRRHGAGSKFPGSGGAALFACRDEAHRAELEAVCRADGHETLRPTVKPARPRLRAVFLAAGFATRLYPLTQRQAKPLLEIGGRPMLTRILDDVIRTGAVSDGVVVTNARFHADFVAWERSARPRLPITVIDDGATTNETRLGAVRDLALALEQTEETATPDGYLVLACDNLFEFDLVRLVDRFAATGQGQLIVRRIPTPVPSGRYSEVLLDGERVARFREKPADPESDLSAIAIYLLPRELPALVREYLGSDRNPDAPGHLLAWLSRRLPLQASRLEGRWLDIGSVEDLERARRMFESAPESSA
ncbi:MAG: NTP transferase domain-containing protein [Planctomycetes bacterium]|nr:NTP transferase domain-containing protein [Planctomycetota bacterium]